MQGDAAAAQAESGALGLIRLNPVERANPAFQADPAFGRTASGAYGGRGPRYDTPAGADSAIGDGGAGRWVRTGGCGFRWVRSDLDSARAVYEVRWRSVAVPDDAQGGAPADADPGVQPTEWGDFSYLDNGDGTATLVGYGGNGAHVAVPAEVDGLAVTVVGAMLFLGHAEIETVSFPDTIRAIDDHAFDGCTLLNHVELPQAVEHVGMFAFAKSGLREVRVPPSVRVVADKAFFHCRSLAEADLGPSLLEIGESAFAYSGLERVLVPASVEKLGFNAFDSTPAQRGLAEGALRVAAGNARYRFVGAGLYCDDALVELVGYVREYAVAPGTRRIAAGACKRHPALHRITLPEGVVEIGPDAFRSNRCLRVVELPESLERIGERAFVDTSIATLRIGRNVAHIGADALLVQGEAQMNPKKPLAAVDLDRRNAVFYLENGLLCERGTSPDGGDTCVLYVGPDAVVRIPEQVTNVAVMAFGGAQGVDELYVHGHVHSFCYGWLSMKESARVVHVEFGEPVDGCPGGDFPLPSLSTRFRYMTDLFRSANGKTIFDFDYYDAWVTCSAAIDEIAPAAYARMMNPVGMSEHSRSVYEGIFKRKGARICRYFAERSNMEALEALVRQGLVGPSCIGSELEVALRDGRPQATACLLEMKHRMDPASSPDLDFSL